MTVRALCAVLLGISRVGWAGKGDENARAAAVDAADGVSEGHHLLDDGPSLPGVVDLGRRREAHWLLLLFLLLFEEIALRNDKNFASEGKENNKGVVYRRKRVKNPTKVEELAVFKKASFYLLEIFFVTVKSRKKISGVSFKAHCTGCESVRCCWYCSLRWEKAMGGRLLSQNV